MKTIEIKHRFTQEVLFIHVQENNTIKVTLEIAVKEDANLQGAELQFANLEDANLEGADLQGAYLRGAKLQFANLEGADLQGADLRGAKLQFANLEGAYLQGADLQDVKHNLTVPKIENLHQKVAEVVTESNLNMSTWHCGTTHCHAGHIVNLAGQEGLDLEQKLGTANAALFIAEKSSKVKLRSSMFYVSNKECLANIKRLAQEEKELK